MDKIKKRKTINIFWTIFFSILCFFFILFPIFSIIGITKSKYRETYDNTIINQTSQSGTVKYVTSKEDPTTKDPYLCKIDNNGEKMDDFKIMVCTDLHLSAQYLNYYVQIEMLGRMIDREKPDLVVLDGDNITDNEYTSSIVHQQALVKMFESKNNIEHLF